MTLGGIGGALGLGVSRIARAMADDVRLEVAGPARVIAVGDRLARALAKAGVPVIALVAKKGRRRKKGPPQVVASLSSLPFSDGSVDALCASGLPVEGSAALREFARVVRDGGLITVATAANALVRKVAPPEVMAARMLHALLVDIEQQQVGSTLLTSAHVRAVQRAP
ncbi:MAG: methyltransferase domain-containing protein [Myxococcales bacterium]|nr:methyltransferase domain-containing protein [Myxococcales bacterium]